MGNQSVLVIHEAQSAVHLTWCHATGNLSMKMTKHVNSCHSPMEPIRSCTGSSDLVASALEEAEREGRGMGMQLLLMSGQLRDLVLIARITFETQGQISNGRKLIVHLPRISPWL